MMHYNKLSKGVNVKTRTIVLISVSAFLLIFLIFIFSIFSILLSGGNPGGGNVALIPVKGVIMSDGSSSIFSADIASSTDIVNAIEKADNDPAIKAMILEINSPGGTAVASDEIGQALKSTNKTKVAWIRDMGTSGAYWIASNCDVIVANRMSITGSIGVLSSYLEFSGLMDDYNVTYERLVSGKYKDIGSPYRKLTDEEQGMLQTQLDKVHEYFIEEVAQNRHIPIENTRNFSTGMIFLGSDAMDMGLVDILGGKREAISYIEDALGIKAEIVEYSKKTGLLNMLAGIMYQGAFTTGRGIASQIQDSQNLYSLNLVS